jgi:hypothetical protein
MKYSLAQLRHTFALRPHSGMRLVYPAREWVIGLFCGTLVLVAGMTYAVIVFRSASNGTDARAAIQSETVTLPYRAQDVRAVLEIYEARARNFKEMRGTLLPPPDRAASEEEVPDVPSDATPVAE